MGTGAGGAMSRGAWGRGSNLGGSVRHTFSKIHGAGRSNNIKPGTNSSTNALRSEIIHISAS